MADVKARQRLCSSSSSSLIVSRTRLSTVGDRAFPVATARVWNSLPEHVTSAPSVAVLRSRLKTHLFDISYPDPVWLYSACAVTLVAFAHYNRPCCCCCKTKYNSNDRQHNTAMHLITLFWINISINNDFRLTSTWHLPDSCPIPWYFKILQTHGHHTLSALTVIMMPNCEARW